MAKKAGKAKVDTRYALKITIQGAQGAGKTFAQQLIAKFLTSYGYSVDLLEIGNPTWNKIPPAKEVAPNGRRVIIDTSLDPILIRL